jgi:electron transfer flavoprotein beta subunit
MKILVPIKRVLDYNVKARVNDEGSGVDVANEKMSMNPFCEIAVEAAIQLKEQQCVDEIIVVSLGEKKSVEQLRAALALGADRAIYIEAPTDLSSLNVAKALQKVVLEEGISLVIAGKQAIDSDNNQTPQMLAALLDWPQGTYASKIEHENGKLLVDREVDGGSERLELSLPAVVSTDLRLNTPRFAKLPDIMKAKKKPLVEKTLEDFAISTESSLSIESVRPPSVRSKGIKVQNVDDLLDKLRNEAKVLSQD